ncbi:MAG: ATP-binding protein [Dethiobacteria bacterium]|jgi:signal transduction histidine kinase|nr:cell wall metabolism sensor histidine kinase WalK [Bacillota bacterium]
MFKTFRGRLTFSFLAVILTVMVLISIFLLNLLEQYYLAYQKEILVNSGNLAAELFSGYLRGGSDLVLLSGLAENFSRQIGARVIVVSKSGMVIGDSVRVGGRLGTPLEREEVLKALEGGTGCSVQYSSFSEQWVMQVAVPLKEAESISGVVFLSYPLKGIYRILTEARYYLLIMTLVAVVVVGVLGAILARYFTRPIEELTLAAQEMAKGNLQQKIKVDSRDEIGRMAQQFNIMAERLNKMTKHLRSFAENVSHELRTPLTSVSLLVKSLREYSMPAEQQHEFLKDIDKETDRLVQLVEDLLDLTRLDKDETYIRKEKVDLKRLLVEVGSKMRPRAERQGHELKVEIEPGLSQVWSSAERLKQVIYNLLDNAIKYTPEPGKIELCAYSQDGEVVIKVVDTGRGIPSADLPHIFERFYRVNKGRSRDLGGTGLGLSICKEIVEALGGKIWVESVEKVGSIFYFTIPETLS